LINKEKQKKRLWYVRRDNSVQGPYPAGLITRYILLGRIRRSDEISSGDDTWTKISDMPELIPEVVQLNSDDPISRQRLMAAKRWADERTVEDRRHLSHGVSHNRRAEDRRFSYGDEEIKHRNVGDITEEIRLQKKKDRRLAGYIAISIVIASGIAMFLLNPVPPVSAIDCDIPPHSGINWNNCHKEGAILTNVNLIGAQMTNMNLMNADIHDSQLVKADLSYSDLSASNLKGTDLRAAILVGADLRQSDLSNSNLKGADLSYADLSEANIRDAQIEDARLGNTIWIDGHKCGPDSIGQCQ
jgi:hypothetical protein